MRRQLRFGDIFTTDVVFLSRLHFESEIHTPLRSQRTLFSDFKFKKSWCDATNVTAQKIERGTEWHLALQYEMLGIPLCIAGTKAP